MAVIQNNAGTQTANVDSKSQLLVMPGFSEIPAAGGHYSVAGQTSAVVAAALAANTTLMAMRFNPASSRKAYIDRLRMHMSVATVGASAGVCGTIGLQRFTTATPTGGSARTVNRMQESAGTATDMYDVRDSNAALTVTSVVFGSIVAVSLVPLMITSLWAEWILKPPRPIVLLPGDGLCLRTQVACAATQTWMYSYHFDWEEK